MTNLFERDPLSTFITNTPKRLKIDSVGQALDLARSLEAKLAAPRRPVSDAADGTLDPAATLESTLPSAPAPPPPAPSPAPNSLDRVLSALKNDPNRLTIADIASQSGLTAGNTIQAVDSAVGHKLVVARPGPEGNDLYELTTLGQSMVQLD